MNYLSEQKNHDKIVADLHCDTVLFLRSGRDFKVRNKQGHIDLPRLHEGGVNIQMFASFIDPELCGEKAFIRANELIGLLRSEFSESEDICLCRSSDDVYEAVRKKSIAALLAIENGTAINSDLSNLNLFYSHGVRSITLVHTRTNDICSSSSDPKSKFDGLTDFGRDVVTRMNELGMIVDISHASAGAVRDTLAISIAPIFASHSCAYAICQHDRNLADEQIRAIAEKGGMIGVNFCGRFLSNDRNILGTKYDMANLEDIKLVRHLTGGGCTKKEFDQKSDQYYEIVLRLKNAMKAAPVTVKTVVDHIDHIVNIGGIDAVGIGSDFDGIPLAPDGLDDCSKLPNLAIELERRGYKPDAIEKILAQNFMRVFEIVCK